MVGLLDKDIVHTYCMVRAKYVLLPVIEVVVMYGSLSRGTRILAMYGYDFSARCEGMNQSVLAQ